MSIEKMKQALEALENIDRWLPTIGQRGLRDYEFDALCALRQAIEQAEKQEPFGWVSQHTVKGPYEWQFNKELSGVYRDNAISILPVYTTPQPQREWVGLTDEEIEAADYITMTREDYEVYSINQDSVMDFARAIEAKLKEKNT